MALQFQSHVFIAMIDRLHGRLRGVNTVGG
jgi:hypothetical protein